MKTFIPSDLVHIALIVSLLRFFPELYNNPRWSAEPLVREVFLGASSAYTQTNFHNIHNRLDRYINSKNIDNYLSSLFLHDLGAYTRSLRRNEFYSPPQNNVIAYIVNNQLDSSNNATVASGDNHNSSNRVTGPEETLSDSVNIGSDLTQEDMDLIEILWKQDIDLGISRDVYDGTWSSSQEIQKQVEKVPPKELKTVNDLEQELPDEPMVVPDPWQGFQYTIDSETGEHIIHNPPCQVEEPLPIQLPPEALQHMGLQEALQLFEGDTYHLVPPVQQLPVCQDVNNQLQNVSQNDSVVDNSQLLLDQLRVLERLSLEARNDTDAPIVMEEEWSGPQLTPESCTQMTSNASGYSHEPENMNISDSQMSQASNLLDEVLFRNTTMPSVNHSENYSSAISDFQMQPVDDRQFLEFLEMLSNGSDPDAGMASSPMHDEINDFFCTNLTNGVSDYLSQLLEDEDINLMDFSTLPEDSDQKELKDINKHEESADSAVSCMSSESPKSDRDWLDSGSDLSHSEDGFSEYHYPRISMPHPRESEKNTKSLCDSTVLPTTLSNSSNDNSDIVLSSESKPFGKHLSECSLSEDSNLSEKFFHNHTYHLQTTESNTGRKVVERDKRVFSETSESRHASRDERRAKSMDIPFSNDEIINLSIEDFNELLAKHDLTEAQLTLVRDIRRRGKNKVAAQNCRKRKLNQIFDLEVEMTDLQSQKVELELQNEEMLNHHRLLKDKYERLYQFVFQSPGPPDPHAFGSQLTDKQDQSGFHAGANATNQDCTKDYKGRSRTKRKQDKK